MIHLLIIQWIAIRKQIHGFHYQMYIIPMNTGGTVQNAGGYGQICRGSTVRTVAQNLTRTAKKISGTLH